MPRSPALTQYVCLSRSSIAVWTGYALDNIAPTDAVAASLGPHCGQHIFFCFVFYIFRYILFFFGNEKHSICHFPTGDKLPRFIFIFISSFSFSLSFYVYRASLTSLNCAILHIFSGLNWSIFDLCMRLVCEIFSVYEISFSVFFFSLFVFFAQIRSRFA